MFVERNKFQTSKMMSVEKIGLVIKKRKVILNHFFKEIDVYLNGLVMKHAEGALA